MNNVQKERPTTESEEPSTREAPEISYKYYKTLNTLHRMESVNNAAKSWRTYVIHHTGI